MMASTLFAALVVAATQAGTAAPPPAAPPAPSAAATPAPNVSPPPEFIQAAQAFGQCLGRGTAAVAPTTTPEAGARAAVTGCAAERTAMETRFEAWIAGPNFPEAGRAMARQEFASQLGGVEAQIAERLRTTRAAAAAPAPATPAPAPTPTPAPR